MPAPFDDITATYTSAHTWMYETSWGHQTLPIARHRTRRVHPGPQARRPIVDNRGDHSTSFENAERFIENYTTPCFLAGLNLAIFRAWIGGRSLDLDDARDLASRTDLVDNDVCRIVGMPILMTSGLRPSAVAEGALRVAY